MVWINIATGFAFLCLIAFNVYDGTMEVRTRMKWLKRYLKRIRRLALPMLALLFCVMVYAPTELVMANPLEIPYSGRQIVPVFLVCFAAAAVLALLLVSLLQKKAWQWAVCLTAGLMLACYVQLNFLNGNLTLLDGSEQEWMHDTGLKIWNGAVFFALVALPFVLRKVFKKSWLSVVSLASAALLLMQGGSLAASLVSEKQPPETIPEYFMRESTGFTFAKDENVIVLVFDSFGNSILDQAIEEHPDALRGMEDFTWYRNCSQVYFKTNPALQYMLTGHEVNMELKSRSERYVDSWQHPYTRGFYENLNKMGYDVELYTKSSFICNLETGWAVKDLVDNMEVSDTTYLILRRKAEIYHTMLSAYSCLPYCLKPVIPVADVNLDDTYLYTTVIQDVFHMDYLTNDEIAMISLDEDSNKKFSVYHTFGAHFPHHLDENGVIDQNVTTTFTQTALGVMYEIRSFLENLKKIGVYENSTIIVTADHGRVEFQSFAPIFFVKRAGEHHEKTIYNTAPIVNGDILPTAAAAVGMDQETFGRPVWDYGEDETRDRRSYIAFVSRDYPRNGNRPNAMTEYIVPEDANDYEHFKDKPVRTFHAYDVFMN